MKTGKKHIRRFFSQTGNFFVVGRIARRVNIEDSVE